jgi:hypothetical protein
MKQINSIILQSGGLFNFDDPENSHFTIEDIAHNLSHLCRFNGACDRFFSVAQHSVNCSRLLQTRQMLGHDGAEAFYGDMTTWLKKLCPDYRGHLARGEDVVADRLGVERGMSDDMKRVDYLALAVERKHLFKNCQLADSDDGFHHIKGLNPLDIMNAEQLMNMEPWTPRFAKLAFLERWDELQ